LVAEGGLNVVGYPMYPSRRFVVAAVTVLHEGLLEYELVDIDETARARWRSLLRATGLLSGPMASRPLRPGPSHEPTALR
jgi:hypothetical protein